jgi:hypothetical protein
LGSLGICLIISSLDCGKRMKNFRLNLHKLLNTSTIVSFQMFLQGKTLTNKIKIFLICMYSDYVETCCIIYDTCCISFLVHKKCFLKLKWCLFYSTVPVPFPEHHVY